MTFFLDNWYLFALAIVSGALLFLPALNVGRRAGVSPAEAVQKINKEKAAVVDVRGAEEFAAGHVKGAKNIALNDVEKHLGAAVKTKATPVLFLCNSGSAASRAVALAQRAGYENALLVTGGMKAWREAGLPVVAGAK